MAWHPKLVQAEPTALGGHVGEADLVRGRGRVGVGGWVWVWGRVWGRAWGRVGGRMRVRVTVRVVVAPSYAWKNCTVPSGYSLPSPREGKVAV